ncbi:TIGR03759 family integrating conjugative element protein [Serratia microhaemolytica]|uniref:TIGR03759 family integrating conjugative element protein n=1 Tax=Serratia microhaemolytica TaxID=2675110 RepID=UPI000FDD574C|nr:TIGR03759 family integrating conjugative element protein [Serratia microhaemolytica]
MKRQLIIPLMLLFSLPVVAANNIANSEITHSQNENSPSQSLQAQAKQWGLSEDAYQRYQQLMSGPRGIQSPGLDPLSVLGIEARSATERREYAEKWVKAEFARTEKELAFQREINAAWQRLYPTILPVNIGNADGVTTGRFALFVRAKDCPTCETRLAAVLRDNRQVDIYLVDSQGNDNTLRQWASDHHIPLEKVRTRQITLNHDRGNWLRFGEGLMPVLLQQREDGWHIAAF